MIVVNSRDINIQKHALELGFFTGFKSKNQKLLSKFSVKIRKWSETGLML